MPFDANAWNRLRYSIYAPAYDWVAGVLASPRRDAIRALAMRPGERALIVGGGTGLDLLHVPAGVHVLITDLTPAMLERARPRARGIGHVALMDGHRLAARDEAFDAVVLHLIVAVIPDPVACLREANRVLRPGGRVSIFDKFLPDDATPSMLRRGANLVVSAIATDLNRQLGPLLRQAASPFRIVSDDPAAFAGLYRRILLRKP
jgi:ubiquinone/menaquinone biosynthesis C-methylase UbiE